MVYSISELIINQSSSYMQNLQKGNKSLSTRRHSAERACVPPTKVFPRLAVNETVLKLRVAAATGRANTHYVGIFST